MTAERDLRKAYDDALNKCGAILSKYEASAHEARLWLLGISTVGAVAGAVVVPVLLARAVIAKGAIAGWSGVSGVANLAQQTIVNEGLDPNSYVTTRGAIVSKMQQYISDYGNARGDYDKQYTAIANLEGACVAYDIAKAAQEVNAFTPPPSPTRPNAPGNVTAAAGTAQATISFEAPDSDGGSPITGYTATASPKNGGAAVTKDGTASPIVVTGLTSGVVYTISVTAKNKFGVSEPATTVVTPN